MISHHVPNLPKNQFWFSDEPFTVKRNGKNQIRFLKNLFGFLIKDHQPSKPLQIHLFFFNKPTGFVKTLINQDYLCFALQHNH